MNSLFKKFTWLAILMVCVFSSCITVKQVRYIQDDKKNNTSEQVVQQKTPYRIQPNDDLYIKVISTDEQSRSFFNAEASDIATITDIKLYLNSYPVTDSGTIQLPIFGKLMVKDLTIEQAKDLIQKNVDEYLNQATVVVKLVSFRITVIGEVARPNRYSILNEQINIFEALGLAGDLTDFGNRKNVKLIRQTETGSIVYRIDLRDKDLLKTDYYYLKPNDIIYVEPMRAKTYGSRSFPFATLLTALTTFVLILSYIKK